MVPGDGGEAKADYVKENHRSGGMDRQCGIRQRADRKMMIKLRDGTAAFQIETG